MRSASCRWLRPLRSRSDRIEYASLRCPRPVLWALMGITSGCGVRAAISASSSSNDRWQRRQRLLDVRNCTNEQWSQRTTSRESTGLNVVAIQVLRVPERGYSQSQLVRNLRYRVCGCQDKSLRSMRLIYAQSRIEQQKSREIQKNYGKSSESTRNRLVFTK